MSLKIIFLIAIFSLSLLGWQIEEAYAAQPDHASSHTKSTTTIKLCFTTTDVDETTIAAADFLIDGVAPASVAAAVVDSDTTDCATTDSILLTAATAFATDATPTVRLVATSVDSEGGGEDGPATNTDQVAADKVAPTYDSAAVVSTTTIDATFSESLTAGTVAVGDWTLSNGITVSSVSVNGAVVTLTTSEFSSILSPIVEMSGSVDDASAATNTLTSAGSKTASFSSAVAAQSGNSGADRSAPSLGSTGFSGVSTIDNGFSYNNVATDVDGWKNDYPTVRTPVGALNTLDLKIKENKGITNIYFVSVHFGAAMVGQPGEAVVTYFPNKAEKLKIDDPNNLLGNVDFTVQPTKCTASSTTNSCLEFSLDHVFNEAPLHDVVGITVADISRNVAYAYFNHGVNVYGDSLNAPVTQTITTHEKHPQQITLTQYDRAQDLWLDENNNTWTKNSFDTWMKLTPEEYTVPDDNIIGQNGMKRINQHFVQYKGEQEMIATQIWDGTLIQSEISDVLATTPLATLNDSTLDQSITSEIEDAKLIWDNSVIQQNVPDYFAFDYSSQFERSDDLSFQNEMEIEEHKAYVLLNQLYRSDIINQMGSNGVNYPQIMSEGFRNGALHVDNSKLEEAKSLETDKAKELLYKMYGKW